MTLLNDDMKQQIQQICDPVLFDEPLSRYTSIRIGGAADAFVYPKTIEEIENLVEWAGKSKLPITVIGSGSNLLVRDKGIRGIVLNLSQGFSRVEVEQSEGSVYVEAGVGIPRLVDLMAEAGLSGIEPLAGIPGNLGGALIMNAGTPDGAIGDVTESVTFLAASTKNLRPILQTWSRDDIRFGYRESHFPRAAILLSARLRLRPLSSEVMKGRIQKYRSDRVGSQPLNIPNLGSVFKNHYHNSGGPAKVMFAGKMIEEAGLKGVRVGGARISSKHGNFIVNEGGAKAKDVLALIGLIRDKVKEKFGVLLEPEVKVIGEE